MVTKKQLKEILEENYPDEAILVIDGMDEAIIGFARRCGQPTIAVYDYNVLVSLHCKMGMTEEEAVEYISFNIEGAWVGEGTPALVVPLDYLT